MLVISSVMLALSIPADSTLIREFAAVLAASPIERLESHAASPTVTDVVLADIDADGRLDAVVSIRPTLRQTPTLLIYRRADIVRDVTRGVPWLSASRSQWEWWSVPCAMPGRFRISSRSLRKTSPSTASSASRLKVGSR